MTGLLIRKKILIEKAYAALPPRGALIVYETIIDDDRRRNVFGLLMSLNMLIETPGGADYTAAECKESDANRLALRPRGPNISSVRKAWWSESSETTLHLGILSGGRFYSECGLLSGDV